MSVKRGFELPFRCSHPFVSIAAAPPVLKVLILEHIDGQLQVGAVSFISYHILKGCVCGGGG